MLNKSLLNAMKRFTLGLPYLLIEEYIPASNASVVKRNQLQSRTAKKESMPYIDFYTKTITQLS